MSQGPVAAWAAVPPAPTRPAAARSSAAASVDALRRGRANKGTYFLMGALAAQIAAMVYWSFVLGFGAHMTVGEPAVLLPAPSRAVPVPRLMI